MQSDSFCGDFGLKLVIDFVKFSWRKHGESNYHKKDNSP